ncbi:MAG: OsmC family protein [Thermoplasmata archaeon]
MVETYEYPAKIDWLGERKYRIEFFSKGSEGKPKMDVATPPEFNGHPGIYSPEDLFVASVLSCYMATFISISNKMKIGIEKFTCEGKGILERDEKGMMFTSVILKPHIVLKDKTQLEKGLKAANLAEENCLVARSIKTKTKLEPKVE